MVHLPAVRQRGFCAVVAFLQHLAFAPRVLTPLAFEFTFEIMPAAVASKAKGMSEMGTVRTSIFGGMRFLCFFESFSIQPPPAIDSRFIGVHRSSSEFSICAARRKGAVSPRAAGFYGTTHYHLFEFSG